MHEENIEGLKLCGKLSYIDIFFDNILFSGVIKVEDSVAEGVNYYGPVETRHKGFFLATLEKIN